MNSPIDHKRTERNTLKLMLQSTEFLTYIGSPLRMIFQTYQRNEFIQSKETETIMRWVLDYFEAYHKAPQFDIESVVWRECDKIKRNEPIMAELLEALVQSICDEIEEEDIEYNAKAQWDITKEYFNIRRAAILSRDLEHGVQSIDTEYIDEALQRFQGTEATTSKITSMLEDEDLVDRAFAQKSEPLLELPGAIGELLNRHMVPGGFISFLGAEKRGKCIAEGQKVLLSNGSWKSIEHVVRDKTASVMCYNEQTGKIESSNVLEWYNNGQKDTVRVLFKSGREIILTPDHPLLSPSGWKYVSDMKIGDFAANPRAFEIDGKSVFAEYEIRLLAYLIAEGCLTHNEVLFTNQAKFIQHDFVRCVELMGDQVTQIDCQEFRVKNHKKHGRKQNKNQTMILMKQMGLMGCSSKTKQIPRQMFISNDQDVALFLNILFTCDGWVCKDEIGIGFANEILTKQVQSLLMRFGILGKIRYKHQTDSWALCIRSASEKYAFYQKIGFSSPKDKDIEKHSKIWKDIPARTFLDRIPYEIALKRLEQIEQHTEKSKQELHDLVDHRIWSDLNLNIKNRGRRIVTMQQTWNKLCKTSEAKKIIQEDVFWDEIVSIENMGIKNVYDITVENNHNFIVENCLVHNSWILLYLQMMAAAQRVPTLQFHCGDMTEEDVTARVGIYLTRRSNDMDYCGEIAIPVLDCAKSQSGECTGAGLVWPNQENPGERKSRNKDKAEAEPDAIWDLDSIKSLLKDNKNYVPCTECRRNGTRDYKGAVYWKLRPKIDPLTAFDQKEAYKDFIERHRLSKLARPLMAEYPTFVLSISEMRAILEERKAAGKLPKIVLIDYADLLRQESKDPRLSAHMIWGGLRGLASEFGILIVTVTQTNKEGLMTQLLDESNFSESKTKNAHVTALFGLNQTPKEKEMGILRINTILARGAKFNKRRAVAVLQCLEIGQPIMGSYWT